ncbi:MAG: hypothetical protein Q4F31_10355, partial [Eubacteriales bacterium]|nr:hypothetical protein [Eubacteriales bacterium]
MKTISVLLVFVLLAGFVPFQQPGYADAAINTMEDLRSNAGTAEDDNETITLRFASGNYVFNATVEIPEEKNVVILADGSDVCFSHGAFSGEMFFVPETSSLKIAGYNDDPASPIKFTNTYSLEDLIQAEAPAVEEVPEEEIQEIPEDPSFDGESGNGLGGSEGEYYEDGEELNVYEETLTEVFVKSFSTLALVGEPVNLRAIVAEGPLSLEYVSFEGFVAPAGLSGAAVSLESGSSENSEFRFVKFKNCKDSENYALCIDGGRTLFMENVSADGNCRIKNKDGNVTVSSIEIGDIIDGGFEVKAEEIVEEVVEEPEEIVE